MAGIRPGGGTQLPRSASGAQAAGGPGSRSDAAPTAAPAAVEQAIRGCACMGASPSARTSTTTLELGARPASLEAPARTSTPGGTSRPAAAATAGTPLTDVSAATGAAIANRSGMGSGGPGPVDTPALRQHYNAVATAVFARYGDIGAAKANGFRITSRDDSQTLHLENNSDAGMGDLANPTGLVYRRMEDGQFRLIGAFYGARPGQQLDTTGLNLYSHSHSNQITHIWFTPGSMQDAFGDRMDPPDSLMGSVAFNRGGSAIRHDRAGIQAIEAAYNAI